MRSRSGTIRTVSSEHQLVKLRAYSAIDFDSGRVLPDAHRVVRHCLVDSLFPDVGKATVALLERLGHQVEFPEAQTCCGQMHVNTGYQPEALPLVRRYVDTFEPYEAIVAPVGVVCRVGTAPARDGRPQVCR